MTTREGFALSAAVGCGVVAGVFFAFSTFVMPALARLPASQGVAAMQAINVAAINRWFMSALFGAAALCVVLAILSLRAWAAPGAKLCFAGSVAYLVGAIAVTIGFNVPRNEALAMLAPTDASAGVLWSRFVAEWSFFNHVRTASSVSATALIALSLLSPFR